MNRKLKALQQMIDEAGFCQDNRMPNATQRISRDIVGFLSTVTMPNSQMRVSGRDYKAIYCSDTKKLTIEVK